MQKRPKRRYSGHRVAKDFAARLGKTAIVKDFKVLDGQNIGALVAFESDDFTTWFFEDELRP
ncbi:MAG: cytochrome b6f subunit family protein, partial [Cyanobacteria bacterium J06635_11]